MSDDEIRTAERTYRASGAPQDGEAYVQAVLRSTGLPSTFLIARVIETQRGLNTLLAVNELRMPGGVTRAMREAINRQVTPDDMVSFLRGGREWLEPPSVVNLTTPEDAAALRFVGGAVRPAIHAAPGSTDGYRRVAPPRDSPGMTQLPAFRQYPGCHYAGCYEEATVHGELAEPMWCAGHVGGQLVAPTLGVPAGSAILCNHANENPGHCPCEPDCYCRQDGHTCSDVSAVWFNQSLNDIVRRGGNCRRGRDQRRL